MTNFHIDTKCVQAGWQPKNGEPRVLPIYQSTTFKYESAEQLGKLFGLEELGSFYSRVTNPTNDLVAAKITELEGGAIGLLTSSGQSAVYYSVFNIAEQGDHIISAASIYGGSYNLFANIISKMGIEVTFVDQNASIEELQKYFKPNTKLVFAETLANPELKVLDIEKFANLAHQNEVPLIVDNTLASPINLRPFEWGADIIVHSTTKYLDGHATSLGGIVIDGGKFDWSKYPNKYPSLTSPNASYGNIIYTEAFGPVAYYAKLLTTLLRDLGACASPNNSFLLNIGIETLHLRIPRHNTNGLAVAEYLEQHPQVKSVNYPGLKSSPEYALAQKYLPNGQSGVVSFKIKGSKENAVKFLDSLKLAAIVTHVADARTSVIHPYTTTHRQLTHEQKISIGIDENLIRISVGIENIKDIIDDIEQALAIAF